VRILVAADPRAATDDGEIFAALLEHGADVQIVVPDGPNRAAAASGAVLPEALATHVHTGRTSPRGWVRQMAPDVVLVDHGRSPLTAARWVAAARGAGVPVALCAWADVEAPAGPARVLERRTLLRADGVYARTPAAARRARDAAGRLRVGLVPPSVSANGTAGAPPANRMFTVGFAGPLHEDDGISDLLATVDRLPRDTRLLVVGDGPLRADVERHAKVDLHTGSADIAARFAEMDVLVVPSRRPATSRDVLGPALLGAMAAGTPVIGSATGDIPWVLSEAGAGMTFPPGDVRTLADLLVDARTDADRWRAAGQRARAEVVSRFSPAASAAALLHLAERLVEGQ
jgi:glycosyltransferase involved in cell wall biosynthesis